jgi:hypothetical protein
MESNILNYEDALAKQDALYSKDNANPINGSAIAASQAFFEKLLEYDEVVSRLKNEDEPSYVYYRSFMTTIDANFLGFAKQVIKGWMRKDSKFYRGIYQRQETSMKIMTTESMRHQTVPAKETVNYCHLWVNWFISEINKINLKLEKRKALTLKDIAVKYTASSIVDELLQVHREDSLYQQLLSVYLRNEAGDTKLYGLFPEGKKQLLMSISFIENRMLLNSINAVLLYSIRDRVLPDKYILDGVDINPTIDSSLTRDKMKR